MAFGAGNFVERKEDIDYSKNKIVSVIGSFDAKGNLKPIRFRYTYDNGESDAVKIECIHYTKSNACFGTIYCCEVTIFDIKKTIYLSFHTKDVVWTLIV